jgi:hypothetical protein
MRLIPFVLLLPNYRFQPFSGDTEYHDGGIQECGHRSSLKIPDLVMCENRETKTILIAASTFKVVIADWRAIFGA